MNEMYKIIADYVEENREKVSEMIESMLASACDVRLEAEFDIVSKKVEKIYVHEGDGEYVNANEKIIVSLISLNTMQIKEMNDSGDDIVSLVDDLWDELDGKLTNLMNQ